MNQIKRDTCVFSTWFINLCDTQDQLFPVELSFFTGEVWKRLLKKVCSLERGEGKFPKTWLKTNKYGWGRKFCFPYVLSANKEMAVIQDGNRSCSRTIWRKNHLFCAGATKKLFLLESVFGINITIKIFLHIAQCFPFFGKNIGVANIKRLFF